MFEGLGSEMRRREALKAGAVGGAVLLGGSALAACGGSDEPASEGSTSTGGSPASGEPVRGGTLRLGMTSGGQSETVSPGIAAAYTDIARAAMLFEGLYVLGPDGVAVPSLAESATPNKDATVWEFKLRDDVTWHDGKPLTAEDVVGSIETWVDINGNYGAATMIALIDKKRVKAIDKRTVQIGLNFAVADFPTMTAQYYYSIVRKGTDFGKGATPAGTGPWVYESFTPGKTSTFSANKNHWKQVPYLDELVLDSSFTDDGARVNALLSGATDVCPNMPFALAKANEGQIRLGNASGANPNYIVCRVDMEPYSDPKVMQAMKLAIDRETMVQNVFSGYADVSNDLPNYKQKYFNDLPVREHDPEQAKSLLKSAGKEGLSITIEVAPYNPGQVEAATLYAQQAKEAGITVNVKKVEASTYYTYEAGWLKRPAMVGAPGAGSSMPGIVSFALVNMLKGGPAAEMHWGENPANQQQILDACAQTDEAKAQEKWNELQQNLYDNGGLVIYGQGRVLDGFANKVKGVDSSAAGYCNNFDFTTAYIEA